MRGIQLVVTCLLAWCSLGASAPPPPRANDLHYPDDKPAITWKETPEATAAANKDVWDKELRTLLAKDPQSIPDRLAARMIYLHEAMLQKFTLTPAQRIAAYTQMAEYCYNMQHTNMRCYGNWYSKRIIDEFPGNTQAAADALGQVLGHTPWNDPQHCEGGPQWVDWAARRAIALYRAKLIPREHPAVSPAFEYLIAVRMRENRFFEADQLLEALCQGKWDNALLKRHADVLSAGGHVLAAADIYERVGQTDLAEGLRNTAERAVPDFARQPAIDAKWTAFSEQNPAERMAAMEGLLADRDIIEYIAADGPMRAGGLWQHIDRFLVANPTVMAELRGRQQAAASSMLEKAVRDDDADAMLAVFRAYPAASAGSSALVMHGERMLMQASHAMARRSFADALAHSADAQTRAQARVGLLLSLSAMGDRAELEKALAVAAPGEPLPLLGKNETVASLRAKLLAAMPAPKPASAPAPAPAPVPTPTAGAPTAAVRMFTPPAFFPWCPLFVELMGGQIRATPPSLWQATHAGDYTVLAGANGLACYGKDTGRPLWTRYCNVPPGYKFPTYMHHIFSGTGDHLVGYGPFGVCVREGRAYTRWGQYFPDHTVAQAVACFSLADGEMLWSTENNPGLRGYFLASDPVEAEGRVYAFLTGSGLLSRCAVACFDARDGRLLWKRAIGSQQMAVGGVQIAYYSNAPLVADGAVYVMTSMGMVVRLDARDGVVEWVAQYLRYSNGQPADIMNRFGGSMMLEGGRLVVAPRDYLGVFMLDCATGQRIWEAPLVPSGYIAGEQDGKVILSDSHNVAAVDTRTGRTLWARQFEDGVLGRCAIRGAEVCVATEDGMARLRLADGLAEPNQKWADRPVRDLAVRGGELVGMPADRITAVAVNQPLNPSAPPTATAPQLPLKLTWQVGRYIPFTWLPKAETGLADRMYLWSNGTLECLLLTPQGGVVWQAGVAPNFQQVFFADKLVIVRYGDRLVALDGLSGKTRWELAPTLGCSAMMAAPPGRLLFWAQNSATGCMELTMVELATGKVAWERHFREMYQWRPLDFRFDAQGNIRALMLGYGNAVEDALINGATGAVISRRRVLDAPADNKLADGMHFMGLSEDIGFMWFYHGNPPGISRFVRSAADKQLVPYNRPMTANFNTWDRPDVQITGPWLNVNNGGTRTILNRDNMAYKLDRPAGRAGGVRDNRLFEWDGRTMLVFDLPSARQIGKYDAPLVEGEPGTLLDYWETADTLFIALGTDPGGWSDSPDYVRVEAFDRVTGARKYSQVIAENFFWKNSWQWPGGGAKNTAAWRNNMLIVSDYYGVRAYAPAAPGERPLDRDNLLLHARRDEVRIDGNLEEWRDQPPMPLVGAGDERGELRLAHDNERLLIALRYKNPASRPRRGGRLTASGDAVLISLRTNAGHYQWRVGIDDRGVPVWERTDGAELAAVPQAACGSEGGGVRTWEIALPLAELADRRDDINQPWRACQLQVSAVLDAPDAQGSARMLSWGWGSAGAPGRPLQCPAGEQLSLLAPTKDQYAAALAAADELPELAASWQVFQRHLALTKTSYEAYLAACREYITRHPTSPQVEQAMLLMDRRMRQGLAVDPTAEIIAFATSAKVPPDVIVRYTSQARSYLSQWVFMEKAKGMPYNVTVELMDDFGKWRPGVQFPAADGWSELRIPLIYRGLHDRTIHGISFSQRGSGPVYWDRTAVVRDGQEAVAIEDDEPAGETEGDWVWNAKVARSGTKSHTYPFGAWNTTTGHRIFNLRTPMYQHMLPGTGPYVSQYVYLDPARTPTSIAILLHNGEGWQVFAWGDGRQGGRYMGPLPPAGQWTELRVPLSVPHLAGANVEGVAFWQAGGIAYWDKTAVATSAGAVMLIDQETPKGTQAGAEWLWVPAPAGDKRKVHTSQGDGTHGVMGLPAFINQHVAVVAAKSLALLEKHSPAMADPAAYAMFRNIAWAAKADAPARLTMYKAFISASPAQAAMPQVARDVLALHHGQPAPAEAAAKFLADCGLSEADLHKARSAMGGYIRTWQVLGPMFSGLQETDSPLYPYPDGVSFKPHTGSLGAVLWTRAPSTADYVDFSVLTQSAAPRSMGYAVCWVHSPHERTVRVALGSADIASVWVNKALALKNRQLRTPAPGSQKASVTLKAGWNEVFVSLENTAGHWGFSLQLLDDQTLLPLDGVRTSDDQNSNADATGRN